MIGLIIFSKKRNTDLTVIIEKLLVSRLYSNIFHGLNFDLRLTLFHSDSMRINISGYIL